VTQRKAEKFGFIGAPHLGCRRHANTCRLIIFPVTPPPEFAAVIKAGFRPKRCAVTTCKFPNKALEAVSFR
jgi:hypothetical protein